MIILTTFQKITNIKNEHESLYSFISISAILIKIILQEIIYSSFFNKKVSNKDSSIENGRKDPLESASSWI